MTNRSWVKGMTLALVLGSCGGGGAIGGDWPEFRGPGGQGHSTARQVPVHWDANRNVVWRTRVPGQGWSSPVLVGRRVYVTTAVAMGGDAPHSFRILAFDAVSGEVVWDREGLRPAASAGGKHGKNSHASPTPVVRDGRLYAHFGHVGTVCLDLEGTVLWRQEEVRYEPVHGNGSSPVLQGDLLIYSADGASEPRLVALDRETGRVRWQTPRDTPAPKTFSFSTPLVVTDVEGSAQVISPASGLVAGYELGTGRERWRFRYGTGYSVVPRPVVGHGMVWVSSGYDRPTLYAIRLDGATGDITESHLAWSLSRGAPNTPSPLLLDDALYIVSDGGIATCLDARTGAVRWNERLGGGFSASPVTAEGRIYFQNETGTGWVLAAGPEFRPLATNELGERTLASYAVTDGALLIRTEEHLYRIGSR